MENFTAATDAVGGSLGLSALVALIPLATFFAMLLGVKARAHTSALAALTAALLVAWLGFKMPLGLAALSATQGAAFGLFPIVWIIVMALWFYELTVTSGRFEDLRLLFDRIGGGDLRIQTILIAFCFGGLLEALAGFGAPVAITATMVMALGVAPLRAAIAVLLANTAPVAFGALAIPITTAGSLTGEDPAAIGAIVGVQAPFVAWIVPFVLLFVLDELRGIKDAWPAALVIGLSFGIAQWWSATHFSYEMTDIVACLASLGAAVLFLKVWTPRGTAEVRERLGVTAPVSTAELKPVRVWMALLPYLLVVAFFAVANMWKLGIDVPAALASTTLEIPWPGLSEHLLTADGSVVASTTYKLAWLSSPGTILLITGLVVAAIYTIFSEHGRYRLGMGAALGLIGTCAWRMRWAALTIAAVLALAYVMNFSGQTVSIGAYLASLGAIFAFLSPILGWLGTAVTGSDTSANALFSNLQHTAATNAGIDPKLLLAANTSGGVVGKMISPQSLAIAATAVQMEGKESEIFKKVIPWSIGLLFIICSLVFLQSNVLAWMLP
ncbi:L-lactate permease [Brevibacterium luteolum]|uniref:L-lactate permease n=1 Tax=Brevibacterium luteolum TaxID=199591 RepID=UPI00223C2324|nr:L-lactate permease [Brevibacterium luteolum]MCT1828602.1 L-lactate permease [Brevibacterium luteolum]